LAPVTLARVRGRVPQRSGVWAGSECANVALAEVQESPKVGNGGSG